MKSSLNLFVSNESDSRFKPLDLGMNGVMKDPIWLFPSEKMMVMWDLDSFNLVVVLDVKVLRPDWTVALPIGQAGQKAQSYEAVLRSCNVLYIAIRWVRRATNQTDGDVRFSFEKPFGVRGGEFGLSFVIFFATNDGDSG